MIDLTRNANGTVQARLLDMVPGRTGTAYAGWLGERSECFRCGIEATPLDPFAEYKTAITMCSSKMPPSCWTLSTWCGLGAVSVDEGRWRVQQNTMGHRGRTGDPLYGIRRVLQSGADSLSPNQTRRLELAITADPRHEEVSLA